MEKYYYIWIPIVTLFLTQLTKFTIESIMNHKLKWGRLFNGAGGMPSSHTSFASSLTMTIGLSLGFESPLFAISLVFSMIVAYDAMGLRMESGKQAVAINQIVDEIFENDTRIGIKHLKEELGHNPIEVVGGILFGIVWSTFLFWAFV